MNVTSKFGEFKDIKIEPYIDNETYTLSKIEGANEYMLLGFDAPSPEDMDNEWRFWVECGDADGHAETHAADLSQDEMTSLKEMYGKYKVNLLEERAVFLANLHLPDGFKVEQFEIYRKGDLKGYGNGYLVDSKKDTGYEFLFRFNDPANGEPNTLVSIDYGWEIEDSQLVFNNLEYSIQLVAQENAKLLEVIGVIPEKKVSLDEKVKNASEKLPDHMDKEKPRDEIAL